MTGEVHIFDCAHWKLSDPHGIESYSLLAARSPIPLDDILLDRNASPYYELQVACSEILQKTSKGGMMIGLVEIV